MTTLYFNVKGGLKTGNIIIDGTSGNISGVLEADLGNLVTANYFTGDGSLLSNINGANVTGQVGNALIAGTVYSNAQPNITSVGTLSSLTVTGNIGAGNISGGNLVSANYLSGTLTTQAQPNITSTGTLTTLDVTGNVTAGNVSTTGTITSTGNITAPYIYANVVGNISGTITVPGNNTAVLFNQTGNAGASDALKFDYAANILTVGGNLTSQNANLGNLVVANYHSGDGGLLSNIAGGNVTGTVANANMAAYAGNVVNAAQGNITSVGTLSSLSVTGLTTATGGLKTSDIQDSTGTNTISVNSGTVGIVGNLSVGTGGTGNVTATNLTGNLTTAAQPNITSVGTLTSVNVSGNVTSGNVLGGNLVSANYITGTLTTQAQPNITSVGTLMGLGVTGNIDVTGNINVTGNLNYSNVTDLVVGDPLIYLGANNTGNLYDLGIVASYNDGSYYHTGVARNHNDGVWTIFDKVVAEPTTVIDWANATIGSFKAGNITAGNISGANLISANYISGTLTTAAQANITSTGTLNSVTATGTVDFTGVSNVSLGTVSNLHISGGSSGYLLTTNGSGGLSWAAPASTSQIVNGTSNVNIASSGGNVTVGVGGTANVIVVDSGGANVTGNLTVSGNVVAAKLSSTGGVSVDSNVSGVNYVIANYFQGNGSALSSITGGNVTGQVGNALVAGTVYSNAQPNITSVGTLNSVTINGTLNATGASNVALGPVANVHITGGSSGYLLSTDGSGGLSFIAPPSTSQIANGTSNVSIGTSGGNVTVGVGGTANVIVVDTGGANVTGNLTVSGNLIAGNLTTGGAGGGNISGANYVIANYFQGDGSQLTNLNASNIASGTIPSSILGNSTVYIGTTSVALNRASGALTLTGITSIDGYAATVSANAQPNITSLGTLSSLAVTGNATVGNVVINNGIQSNRANVSVSTNTVVDSFSPSTFRTAKYIISASGSGGYQSVEALMVHDGTNAYITIYGSVCSNVSVDVIDISANINGGSGNVTLYATASGSSTLVNVVATYLKT